MRYSNGSRHRVTCKTVTPDERAKRLRWGNWVAWESLATFYGIPSTLAARLWSWPCCPLPPWALFPRGNGRFAHLPKSSDQPQAREAQTNPCQDAPPKSGLRVCQSTLPSRRCSSSYLEEAEGRLDFRPLTGVSVATFFAPSRSGRPPLPPAM